jgi:hypothetical protein
MTLAVNSRFMFTLREAFHGLGDVICERTLVTWSKTGVTMFCCG